MRVALDVSPLYTGLGGVARYVQGLREGLAGCPALTVRSLGWAVPNWDYTRPGRAVRTLAREWGWAKFVAPFQLGDADVLHQPALPLIPFGTGVRHVVTLHDLAILRHPGRYRRWQRLADARRLRRVGCADRVICVSRFTADEAMRELGLPASRLEVIHHGGMLAATAPEGDWPGLPADFFLFVGSLEPGKNLALLRRIYLSSSRPLPPLLVVGARWAGVAGEGEPPPDWHYLGHVDDAKLCALYRRARALLFPSLYEGFGLPVLEAMQQGCPVLCGPVASLPEVGGDAVAYAALEDGVFGAAMRRLATDSAWRDELAEAGRVRGAGFSWTRCAAETVSVYAAALNGPATL